MLILEGFGSSGRQIGAPQKRQTQPRRIQPPILGPLILNPAKISPIQVPWTWEREPRGQKRKSLQKVSKKSPGLGPKSPKKVLKKSRKRNIFRLCVYFSDLSRDFFWPLSGPQNLKSLMKIIQFEAAAANLEISPAIYRVQNPENPKSLKKVSREDFGTSDPGPRKSLEESRK